MLQASRPEQGVCPVRGSASTCVSGAQVRDATLRTQCLVALGLMGRNMAAVKQLTLCMPFGVCGFLSVCFCGAGN